MNRILNIVVCILGIAIFICCDKKPLPNPQDNPQETISNPVNTWAHDIMVGNYYWANDIPAKSSLNFAAEPELFFYSLLSRSDGKHNSDNDYYYSSIEYMGESTRANSTETSYGYIPFFIRYNNVSFMHMRIRYVVPGSPAAEAGIKRGDTFSKFDGQDITMNNYLQFYNNKMPMTLKQVELSLTSNGVAQQDIGDVNLGAAKEIEVNPFYKRTTLTVNGKKINYLMYSSFVNGKTDSSIEYINQMRQIFDEFKSNPADAFILDLRNNGGGLVSCAQQLATLLAPASALDKTLGYLEYRNGTKLIINFSQGDKSHNIDLSTLYIIVSDLTASSSEFVINALKPYMGNNLVIVGTTTEGKNVASVEYEGVGDAEGWVIRPIVSKIFNSRNESNYESGFTPASNHYVYEYDNENIISKWYEYGDTEEYLLKNTLNVIKTGSVLNPTRATTTSNIQVIIPKRESLLILDTIK